MAEICRRLDGIALAIELAAARMVSMSAQDVRDRLGDRFRLLSGSRRGLGTPPDAAQHRAMVLRPARRRRTGGVAAAVRCSPAGSIWPPPPHICGDGSTSTRCWTVLDSLVRKSLVTAEQRRSATPATGCWRRSASSPRNSWPPPARSTHVRDRHARYFAEQAVAHWDLWDGPRQRVAVDWVDVEFANLRAGFRWAADHGDLVTAAAIAAHTTMLGFVLQRFEPVGLGRRDPPRRHRRRPRATPPPLHRRQPVLL